MSALIVVGKVDVRKCSCCLKTTRLETMFYIPEDKAQSEAIRAKIEAVKEQISGLRRDRSPSSIVDTRGGDRSADAEKLERSRSGHLAQITILGKNLMLY